MSVFGYLGWGIVLTCLGIRCAVRLTSSWPLRLGIVAAVVFAAFGISFGDVSLAGFVIALQSEPSFALLLIVAICATRAIWPYSITQESIYRLCLCYLLLGIILYPSALGFGPVDLYAVGYHPYATVVLLLASLLVCLFFATRIVGVWVAPALLAHSYGVGESDNVWDYLIDPIAFSCSLWLVAERVSRLRTCQRP